MKKIQLQDLHEKQAPAGAGISVMDVFKFANPEGGAQKIALQDLTAKQAPAGTGGPVMFPHRQRSPQSTTTQQAVPTAPLK